MKEILNSYKNTFTGLVIVFSFLVTFCITYYTVKLTTSNESYGTIAGLCGIIIVFLCYIIDLVSKSNSKKIRDTSNDLEPRGINENQSKYPELEHEGQIQYDEKHAQEANPIRKINSKKSA